MSRGRKRLRNMSIPAHIEQTKLPKYCYWDKSKLHWYAIVQLEDSKPSRKRIASEEATLSDLHRYMEELQMIETNTFRWLSGLYKETSKFQNEISTSTKKNYLGSEKILLMHPTKIDKPLGMVPLSAWKNRDVQKLIDSIAENNGPRAANMCLSYAHLVFKWGLNRGYCSHNPCINIERAKERKRRRIPSTETFTKLINLARSKYPPAKPGALVL
jgi:hypothetical protein